MNITASVVLVGTKHTFNIGLVSRAMSNYGIDELILVEPRCEVDVDAYHGAAGGNDPLKKLVRVSSWEQFLKLFPPGYRLGFFRRMDQPFVLAEFPLHHAVETMTSHLVRSESASESKKIYLVFGREDSGLSRADLEMMNGTMTFATWGYPSMSLSHAVTTGLLTFRLSAESLQLHRPFPDVSAAPRKIAQDSAQSGRPSDPHSVASVFGALDRMEPEPKDRTEPEPKDSGDSAIELDVQAGIAEWLETLGLKLDQPHNASSKFLALIRRAAPSDQEWAMLKKLFYQTARKLRAPLPPK
jgi:tRNA C32,U32 (ribose-2'-O)-methylase TrmJ